MSRNGLRDSGADDGFTLVELIVAVLIIGVITVPLGNVVIGYLRNTDATTARLIESHDVQITSAYWAQDAASIGTRSAGPTYTLNQSIWTGASSLYSCPTAGTPIVSLAWDDFSSAGTTTLVQVVYMVQTVSGQTELHRVRCEQSSGVVTVVSNLTLSHYLASTPPVVACPTTLTECTPGPPTMVPTRVQLTLTLKDPGNQTGVYVVPLTGQRRQTS
jgi:prepilin-type N-terminal cleavage/methylation domain-containing protein